MGVLRVALIDNGVDPTAYLLSTCFLIRSKKNKSLDLHASRCAAIISKYNYIYSPEDNFMLYDLKVLDGNCGNAKALLKALKWCLYKNINIISISCGTNDLTLQNKIQKIIYKLCKKGIIIIAAASNNGLYTIPAELEGVVGIKTKPFLKNDEFYTIGSHLQDAGINVIASSVHVIKRTNKENETTSICNSFAAPFICALIGSYLNDYANNPNIVQSPSDYINYRLLTDPRNILKKLDGVR